MTCIVGMIDDKRVVMGGDSAEVGGTDTGVTRFSKVRQVGNWLIGFAGAFRAGQLVHATFHPPDQEYVVPTLGFMVAEFIPALKAVLKNEPEGWTILVGRNCHLFRICSDYGVRASEMPYEAIGSGSRVALGSLYSSTGSTGHRVALALNAAAYFHTDVRAPFQILSI